MSTLHSQSGEVGPDGLRLAFLAELYHPHVGGQEIFFQELAEAMVRRGHSVDVYCITHDAALPARETLNGVRIHRSNGSGIYPKPVIPALRRNWSDIVRYSAGVRRLGFGPPHDFYLLNQWPLLHVPALPRWARARSGIHWCEVRTTGPVRVLQKHLPRMVATNFAVGEAVAASIGRESGREFTVLPSGIELARYRSTERSGRSGVLYVGRLAPHKNMPLLVDAFDLAVSQGLEGDLVIAGDGPSRAEVAEYASRSVNASRIQVLGSIDEEQKVDLLSRAAVLGMSSIREGFPRVIAEAMASGLPVVTAAFEENGGKDVVAQYGSGIVCGTQPADFAAALLAANAGWDGFSRAGLVGAQSLDWSGIAATFEAKIRQVVPMQLAEIYN
ncbi:glycosyltransferase family 4 protein [Mycobacterium hodleri]|uniref:glycosyltransferase family 4 protein n=1 Tax=Mycolicibacterium hodleri TaxID=49897 RepID=UPI0021F3C177|nr:glycosyltransferase family 4 protein [Mycolicibacterium hodleri]MCV7136668.1 glycosyltransferase family 4 protein [Mycolicibacterium hodleri]